LLFCITEYQEKIRSCKEKVEKAKAESISDDELNELQNKMEEQLKEEKQLRQQLR
jgi:predicted transcriptional regulator